MGSIKVILRQKKVNDDGIYPLVIRIIKDRKTSFIYIGNSIKLKDWDEKEFKVKKSHPNSGLLNKKIQDKLTEAHKLVLQSEESANYTPVKMIGAKLSGKTKEVFAALAKNHLHDLEKLHKYNRLATDKARVKYFNEFLGGGDVPFKAIDPALLRRFIVHIKSNKNVNDRTVMNYLILIRYLFNKAISLGMVERSLYPFGPGKIQIRFEETHKIGLTETEVVIIENKELVNGSKEWNARNIWLASFYLAGIRVSDVLQLKWEDFVDGRLYYKMGKNKKKVSFKVPEKVNKILSLYKKSKTGNVFIFPYLNESHTNSQLILQKQVRHANSTINKCLKKIALDCEIKKNLSMHISRHTFGNIASDKVSPQALQKLYRHSDLKTTIGYQANFIHKDVDDALDRVINFEKK